MDTVFFHVFNLGRDRMLKVSASCDFRYKLLVITII
jgi:hypothetical protein